MWKALAAIACGFFGAFLFSLWSAPQPDLSNHSWQMALADSNCGNGGPCSAQLGTTQSGTDPGGGICGLPYSLCNPITGTVTLSNATPLAFTNTTGGTSVTNSNTNATTFACSATGTNPCYIFAAPTSGTGSSIRSAGHIAFTASCGTQTTPVANASACASGVGAVASVASSGSITWTPNWSTEPVCTARDATTPANVVTVTVHSVSTLTMTNTGGADTDTIVFQCFGNNGG